jgi:hypothetical protein
VLKCSAAIFTVLKVIKVLFLQTNGDIVTDPKDLHMNCIMKHKFLLLIQNNDGHFFFLKECNELFLIHYLILSLTVPLQLLVTAT